MPLTLAINFVRIHDNYLVNYLHSNEVAFTTNCIYENTNSYSIPNIPLWKPFILFFSNKKYNIIISMILEFELRKVFRIQNEEFGFIWVCWVP